ncbi:MAG: DNA translocase FtsK [Oscillospiraceae bacterium]|nr:DNA translocase FtsK [Oscillospiraceae bacterium]
MPPRKNTTRKKEPDSGKQASQVRRAPRRREIGAVVCFLLGVFTAIAYFSPDAMLIAWLRALFTGLLGWGLYFVPPAFFVIAVILTFHRGRPVIVRVVSASLLPVLLGALIHLFFSGVTDSRVGHLWETGVDTASGGVLCGLLANGLRSMVTVVGAAILLFVLLGFLLLLAFNKTPADVIEWFKNREPRAYEPEPDYGDAPPIRESQAARRRPASIDIPLDGEEAPPSRSRAGIPKPGRRSNIKLQDSDVSPPDRYLKENQEPPAAPPIRRRVAIDIPLDGEGRVPFVEESPAVPNLTGYQNQRTSPIPPPPPPAPDADKVRPADVAAAKSEITRDIEKNLSAAQADYVYPNVSLLKQVRNNASDGSKEVAQNADRLADALESFGIEASIVNATRGPAVTRYEVELEPGVKLAKLTNLAGDLALSLGASGVRIAPIPNKIATVGIEVPNKTVSLVALREVIESENFQTPTGKLTFALGKDISGTCMVGNIAKLPHLLIAGTTGSGKSVTMNSIILSVLYKARPEEVKFIMIDPKMVEFGVFNGIPHLLIPVVTDPKKAAGALQWGVTEMLKRYKVFNETGARDLESYNRYAGTQEDLEPFPQLVVVIDELADLMLVASKEVEESICRIAQMGRAAGIHLVVATQRPSADVITGLMKANIPSRIALSVSSAMESRIIMDEMGAEKLVGNGDMLYKPIGGKPVRIQGTYVSDEEREKVIEFLKQHTTPDYDDSVGSYIDKAASDDKKDAAPSGDGPLDDYDEMFGDAVNMVLDLGQASTSVLQRKLKLGYSRAGRLMDQLEEAGIVGPHMGSKPRQVLISRAEWQAMQAGGEAPPVADSVFADIPKDDFSDHGAEEEYEEQSYD